MKLHLVTGFLGAGKTTTIIQSCKLLMQEGKKVAVITNDQGKYLVDTAFMQASDIPAMDVQSGCFCSHYQDMIKQLEDLQKNVNPDIVFAEAIGSAANLVGTVMQALIADSNFSADSLSAVIDARFMLRLLRHEFLPFSDSITATFMSQISESNYLIINKIDLLSLEDLSFIKSKIKEFYPNKLHLFQSSNNKDNIKVWLNTISTNTTQITADPEFNIDKHKMALNKLQWDEKVLEFEDNLNVFPGIIEHIEKLLRDIKSNNSLVAHIKAFIEYEGKSQKTTCQFYD